MVSSVMYLHADQNRCSRSISLKSTANQIVQSDKDTQYSLMADFCGQLRAVINSSYS